MAWTHWRHVEWGQSAGFSAGSGSWQGPRSGSTGPPARVFGPHFTCCWNLTTVLVRTGLQPLGVSLVKLGAPHGLVQLPLGSDRVGTGRVGSEHSAGFRTGSGWVDAELGDGEGKRKAYVGDDPCALLPTPQVHVAKPCPAVAEFVGTAEGAQGWGPPQ